MTWSKSRHEATDRRDAIQEFADQIIASLEAGVKPWVKPWDESKCGGPQAPMNPVTKKRYRGCNVLILGMDMRAFQTGDSRWCTFKQAIDSGWHVKKGEKATAIFFAESSLAVFPTAVKTKHRTNRASNPTFSSKATLCFTRAKSPAFQNMTRC